MARSTTPALPRYRGALFSSRRIRATVLITAVGQIDAANTAELTSYAQAHAVGAGYLILDLSGLDFFAVHGLSTLFGIQEHCVRRNIGWALVVGPAVNRVLRLAPVGALPITDSVPMAVGLATADRPPLPHCS